MTMYIQRGNVPFYLPLPEPTSTQKNDLFQFFDWVKSETGLFQIEQILNREILDYRNSKIENLFISADQRPREHRPAFVLGVQLLIKDTANRIVCRYIAFYRNGEVEIRTTFSPEDTVGVTTSWKEAFLYIFDEIEKMLAFFYTLSDSCVQRISDIIRLDLPDSEEPDLSKSG